MSRWPERTVLERLHEKVDVDDETGCWIWQAYHDPQGYGRIRVDGESRVAHRIAYELVIGPIPEGLTLDHLCRNRRCVNPAHLEPVTLAENKARGESFAAVNARKTHCPNGHPYDEANTHHAKSGRRCRACNRERARAKAAALVAAREPRVCEAPDCMVLLPIDARAHRLTCSERCKSRLRRVAA